MYWPRFARKSRLVNFEIGGDNNSRVRRRFFALLQNNNVTGHHFAVGDNEFFSFAKHSRFCLHEFIERPKRVLRLAFLDRPDNSIEKKNGENNRAVYSLSHYKNNRACRKKNVNQRTLKLVQKNNRKAAHLPFGKFIEAVFLGTFRCFFCR